MLFYLLARKFVPSIHYTGCSDLMISHDFIQIVRMTKRLDRTIHL